MQLSDVKNGLQRRWKLFLAVSAIVAIALLAAYRPVLKLYRTELRFIVGTQPLDSTLLKEEEKYYLWVASEYVVAGVSDYINAGDFKAEVSERLLADGYTDFDAETVSEFISAGYERSRLILAITHPDEVALERIAFASADTLLSVDSVALADVEQAQPLDIQLPQLQRSPAFVYPIDNDLLVQEIDLSDDVVRAIVPRVLGAIVAGLLAVVLIEFYDPTIRTRISAETLTLPILAEIPND